ncbi:hypothetical protein EJB05_15728, partial [Eragrostis curvula]
MAAMKVYALLFTAFFFSGLMQLSMAQDKPAAARARVVDATAIDQAIAYLLMFAALFAFFSGLMQLSMAKDKPARVIDAQAIDQAIAYLLMFVALFVTYFAS